MTNLGSSARSEMVRKDGEKMKLVAGVLFLCLYPIFLFKSLSKGVSQIDRQDSENRKREKCR